MREEAEEVGDERRVPWPRLKKAQAAFEKLTMEGKVSPPKDMTPDDKQKRLVLELANTFPSWIAKQSTGQWYAAGCRVRGHAIQQCTWPGKILLYNPKPEPWLKKQDGGMPHLKAVTYFPLHMMIEEQSHDVVIVSVSTLQESLVIYGVQCLLRL